MLLESVEPIAVTYDIICDVNGRARVNNPHCTDFFRPILILVRVRPSYLMKDQ